MNIQLVEDDPILARALQINLDLDGHKVFIHHSITEAKKYFKQHSCDVIILDLGLPDGSGFEYLNFVQSENKNIPVLILSAQTDEDSVVKGLLSGAKDFVKKPYSYKELMARLSLIVKKNAISNEAEFEYKNLKLNSQSRMAIYKQNELDLNRREFDILLYFIQNAERIVTRDALLHHLNKDLEIYDRTIDSHISHIRKSLKKYEIYNVKITSVYGLGYRLEESDEK